MRTRRLSNYYRGAAAAVTSTPSTPYTMPARYAPLPARSQYCGINCNALAYYGSNIPFANVMKSSSGFAASGITTDADGYPTSLASGQSARANVLWTGVSYPAGQYVVLWDGEGSLSLPLSYVTVDSSVPGRITFTPQRTDTAIYLQINSTNPANYVRNVRFLLPGTESTYLTNPFNPQYLDAIAPFGVLRFMDWGKTNGSSVVEWADRSLPSNSNYNGAAGVPIEHMIDLANRMRAHPWICIPHQASNDYAAQLATLLHNTLDPTLRPRIEYSNECWNFGFGQTHWMMDKCDAAVPPLSRPYGYPSRYYGPRAVELFNVMRGIYGADAGRLVRVLAGQAAWTQFLSDATAQPGMAGNYDAIAIAPYIVAADIASAANLPGSLSTTDDQVVDQLLTEMRGHVTSWITSHATLANTLGVPMLAYESGPGNVAFGFSTTAYQDGITNILKAGYANARMNALMVEYYTIWKNAGGSTMNHFNDVGLWGKYGLWSLLQHVTDDPATSPTYQGIKSFISANP